MAKGSCLCEAIRFEIDNSGVVLSVGCYCVNCRKISGSQYGVYLQVKPQAFRWLAGQAHVVTYESSAGNGRASCRTCGSVAPVATSFGAVRVPAGALDEDPGVLPEVVLFSTSKAGWCGLEFSAQSFSDAGPPEFWLAAIAKLHGGN